MKKIAGSLITLFLLLAVLSTPLFADGVEPLEGDVSVRLMAGQHTQVGDVLVSNHGEYLSVEFRMFEGWSLGETHLYVGTGFPKKAPGQFPYKGQTSYTIPLSDLEGWSGDALFIAVHAVVQKGDQQETAWGEGAGTFAKSWAMYFRYTVVRDQGC